MNKKAVILKYFQKKDQLTVNNKEYQKTLTALFEWLTDNDKVTNDKTSKFFPNINCKAKIIAKQEAVVAGLEEIKFLLEKYTNLGFRSLISDGSPFQKGMEIVQISGKSYEILGYERTILNILQRLSGIATETSSLISLISPISQIQIAATRKTPWMVLDKKAVAVGGGLTHRLNLSDGILIKDNHLTLSSIEKILKIILKERLPRKLKSSELIEIEVTNRQQAFQAINTFQLFNHSNHLALLLDNFTPSSAKTLLSDLSNFFDLSGIIFEGSGGIRESNIRQWSKTGVDVLSLGSLTHSSCTTNLSLKLVRESQQM